MVYDCLPFPVRIWPSALLRHSSDGVWQVKENPVLHSIKPVQPVEADEADEAFGVVGGGGIAGAFEADGPVAVVAVDAGVAPAPEQF